MKKFFAVGLTALALLLTACGGGGAKPVAVTSPTSTSGTAGTAYSMTLTETGGKAPYTWSLAAGNTLPSGLSLNASTGVISGTPTTPGTYHLSFTVADSSHPPLTATVSVSLTINAPAPTLSITAPNLPAATVGVAYSQTLAASGGTAPYTWIVASGTLPSGLTLNSTTGVISGSPTTAGTSSFSLTVTDASTPTQSATLASSLVVAPPALTITAPTTLPAATVAASYTATLTASGGTPPYTWTVASGALPAGLTLNSATGVLSGTPTSTGVTSFTLEVTDSASTTATEVLSLTVQPASLMGDALLNGQYFVKLDQFSANSPYAYHQAWVGSITFDGAGNATGIIDVADDGETISTQSIAGTYTVNPDGRGTLTFFYAEFSVLQNFAFAVGDIPQGSVAESVRLVEDDGNANPLDGAGSSYGTGFMQLEDPTAFADASLEGTSVFGWSGDSQMQSSNPAAQAGGLALVGQLVVNSGLNLTSASTADVAINQTVATNVPMLGSITEDTTASGSSTNFLTYGRAILNLTSSLNPNAYLAANSVIYIIDAQTAYIVSQPASAYEPLYSGYIYKQAAGPFAQASLTGSSIVYGSGASVDGQANYYNATSTLYRHSNAYLSRFSWDGAGNVTTLADVNLAGTILSSAPSSGTYSVAPSGRVTFGLAGSPIGWLVAPGQGFLISQPPAAPPVLLTMEPQTALSYSAANLSGSYLLGVEQLSSYMSSLFSGYVQVDGAGNVTSTADFFSDGGPQDFGPNAVADTSTATIDSTGRLNLATTYTLNGTPAASQSMVLYMVSPYRAIGIDETPANTSPAIVVLDQLDPASQTAPCTPTILHRLHPAC